MKKSFKFLIVLFLGCVLLTGCGKGNGEVDNRINLNAPEGIKAETFYSFDNSNIIIKLTNETSSDIKMLNVKVNYTGGFLITEVESPVTILRSNTSTYVSLLLPIDDNFASYIPDKFDLNITTEEIDEENDTSAYLDDIEVNYTVNNDKINFNLNNKSGDILGSINSLIVYFKEGKPVATDYVYALDVDKNYETERDIVHTGELDNPKNVDYDNIEVYVLSVSNDYVGYDDIDGDINIPEEDIIEEDVDEDIDEEWE